MEWITEKSEEDYYKHFYTIRLPQEKVIRNINLGYPQGTTEQEFGSVYQCAVSYDKKNDIINFVFLNSIGTKIYVATFSPVAEKCIWKIFDMSQDLGINPIYGTATILLGNFLYGINGDNGPVKIDITDGSCRQLNEVNDIGKDLVTFGSYDPDGPIYTLPYGVWGDMVIWEAPICTDTGIESMFCVFDEAFLGALYIDEAGNCHIYNEMKTESMVIDISGKNLCRTSEHDFVVLPH